MSVKTIDQWLSRLYHYVPKTPRKLRTQYEYSRSGAPLSALDPTTSDSSPTAIPYSIYRPFQEILLLAIVQIFFFFILLFLDAISLQYIALLSEFIVLAVGILGIIIFGLRTENLWIYYVLLVSIGLIIDFILILTKIIFVIICDRHPGCSQYTIWFYAAVIFKIIFTFVQIHAFVISYESYLDWRVYTKQQIQKPLTSEYAGDDLPQ